MTLTFCRWIPKFGIYTNGRRVRAGVTDEESCGVSKAKQRFYMIFSLPLDIVDGADLVWWILNLIGINFRSKALNGSFLRIITPDELVGAVTIAEARITEWRSNLNLRACPITNSRIEIKTKRNLMKAPLYSWKRSLSNPPILATLMISLTSNFNSSPKTEKALCCFPVLPKIRSSGEALMHMRVYYVYIFWTTLMY